MLHLVGPSLRGRVVRTAGLAIDCYQHVPNRWRHAASISAQIECCVLSKVVRHLHAVGPDPVLHEPHPMFRSFRAGEEYLDDTHPLPFAPFVAVQEIDIRGVDAGLDAIEAVYRALADEVGSTNVVVVGDSAGGGLALALAHRSRDVGLPPPGALVLYFPWLDVGVTGADQPRLETIDPALSIDQLREAGRLWSGGDPADPRASPLFADHDELPPTLVLVGTKDLLLSDARRFAGRHPSAIVREYPGMFHGFVCAPMPEAHRALDESAEFIGRHLGRSH